MTPLFADSLPAFYDFYAANLRSGLFSGFLTLSGFLLTAMTLTVIQTKKELCEKDGYVNRVKAARAAIRQSNATRVQAGRKPKSETSFYGGLKRLGVLIWATILCALITSLCQFTLGILSKTDTSAYICVSVAVSTFTLLVVDLVLVGLTIREMFAHWEAEAIEKDRQPAAAG